jgi:ParB-like chromosome segregation protein Spo0J
VENIQRVDLSAKERVEAIRRLAALGLGIREISRRTGLTPATISKWVRLAEKPVVMQVLETGRVDIFRAMQLAPIKDAEQQEQLLAQAARLSKRDFSALAHELASGQPSFCLDDGRLADVDRKLALVRHVMPVGKSHLQRIISTALKLLASVEDGAAVGLGTALAEIDGSDEQVTQEQRVSVSPGKHLHMTRSASGCAPEPTKSQAHALQQV